MKNDKHPLAVNIIKYQRYNFAFLNCQEIVLFETLLVLGGISFKNKEFFIVHKLYLIRLELKNIL